MNVYQSKRIVQLNELDHFKHVNNVVYVKWMQEVSSEHWALLISNIPTPDYVWFVIRHEIDYKKQGALGNEVIKKTWVGETAGIKSIRHFEVRRGEDILVKSQTIFCLFPTLAVV